MHLIRMEFAPDSDRRGLQDKHLLFNVYACGLNLLDNANPEEVLNEAKSNRFIPKLIIGCGGLNIRSRSSLAYGNQGLYIQYLAHRVESFWNLFHQ